MKENLVVHILEFFTFSLSQMKLKQFDSLTVCLLLVLPALLYLTS